MENVNCFPENINEDLSKVNSSGNSEDGQDEMDSGCLNQATADYHYLTPVNEENLFEVKCPDNPGPSNNLLEKLNNDLNQTKEDVSYLAVVNVKDLSLVKSSDNEIVSLSKDDLEIQSRKSPENDDETAATILEEPLTSHQQADSDDIQVIHDLFLPIKSERAKVRVKRQDEIFVLWEGTSEKPSTSSMPKKESKVPAIRSQLSPQPVTLPLSVCKLPLQSPPPSSESLSTLPTIPSGPPAPPSRGFFSPIPDTQAIASKCTESSSSTDSLYIGGKKVGEKKNVEKILAKRFRRGKFEYFIKWKGYPSCENTWEIKDNIRSPGLLEEFEKRSTLKRKRKNSYSTDSSDDSDDPVSCHDFSPATPLDAQKERTSKIASRTLCTKSRKPQRHSSSPKSKDAKEKIIEISSSMKGLLWDHCYSAKQKVETASVPELTGKEPPDPVETINLDSNDEVKVVRDDVNFPVLQMPRDLESPDLDIDYFESLLKD